MKTHPAYLRSRHFARKALTKEFEEMVAANEHDRLSVLRGQAVRFLCILLWFQVLAIGACCWAEGRDLVLPVTAGLALAALAQFTAFRDRVGPIARVVGGVCLMMSISVLVGAASGSKLQVDLHMYYFAALAILTATCDWRAIVAATATVAVHHLAFDVLMPDLVYQGGSDHLRLALHATILVVEAGALSWTALALEQAFDAVAVQTLRAEDALLEAESRHEQIIRATEQGAAARVANEEDRARMAHEDAATLDHLGAALKQLAEGDLGYRIDVDLPAKSATLRFDFNAAMEQLESVVSKVANNAAAIRAGSGDISTATEDLSRRTEHQAASLEETAAALDLMTQSVKQTSDGANLARTVAQKAEVDAERSSDIVRRAVEAMTTIAASSREMSSIIGVIDEIAFQTNLLALNAGVEAARAGDAGRGFAVVASEVRALAQRSAEAAKSIKTLISTSTSQVGVGVGLVNDTGDALGRIAGQVKDLNGMVVEIATRAHEQSEGLGAINTAVTEMDSVTQQNAAMVEQTSAASQSLAGEADELTRLINRFRLRQAAQTTPVARPHTVTSLKVVGRSGAARKPKQAIETSGWQEF